MQRQKLFSTPIRQLEALQDQQIKLQNLKVQELTYLENLKIIFQSNTEEGYIEALRLSVLDNQPIKIIQEQIDGWRKKYPQEKDLLSAFQNYQTQYLDKRNNLLNTMSNTIKLSTQTITDIISPLQVSSNATQQINKKARVINQFLDPKQQTEQIGLPKQLRIILSQNNLLSSHNKEVSKLNAKINTYHAKVEAIAHALETATKENITSEFPAENTILPDEIQGKIDETAKHIDVLDQQIAKLTALKEDCRNSTDDYLTLLTEKDKLPILNQAQLLNMGIERYFSDEKESLIQTQKKVDLAKEDIHSLQSTIEKIKSMEEITDSDFLKNKENLLAIANTMNNTIKKTENNIQLFLEEIKKLTISLTHSDHFSKLQDKVFNSDPPLLLKPTTINDPSAINQQIDTKLKELEDLKIIHEGWLEKYNQRKIIIENERQAGELFKEIEKNAPQKQEQLHNCLQKKFVHEVQREWVEKGITELSKEQAINIYNEIFNRYLVLSDIAKNVDDYNRHLKKQTHYQSEQGEAPKVKLEEKITEPISLKHKIKVYQAVKNALEDNANDSTDKICNALTALHEQKSVKTILSTPRNHGGIRLLSLLGHIATFGLVSRLGSKKTFRFWKTHGEVMLKDNLEKGIKHYQQTRAPKPK